MYKKQKYLIYHLHNYILLHPNYVDSFNEIVQKLYTSNKIYNMIDTLVFELIKQSLKTENQKILKTFRKEFQKNSNDFKNQYTLKNKRPLNKYLTRMGEF
jgi:hypothetical protein